MKYQAIGFDYGGVINGKPGSYFNEQFVKLVGVDKEEYLNAYFSHNRKFNADQPITERELWTLVLTNLNKIEYLDKVMDFVQEMRVGKSTNQNMINLIVDLREKGYKTGLLSNNSQIAADKMREDGIDKYFDSFIVSAEVSLMKPDKAIFELFAKQLEVEIEELIFIDDASRSLSTADECGFTPILFESYGQLTDKLKELKVL